MCGGVLDNRSIYGYVGFTLLFDGCLVVKVVVWVFYFLFYFVVCFDLQVISSLSIYAGQISCRLLFLKKKESRTHDL
jgi:hypothetical protein